MRTISTKDYYNTAHFKLNDDDVEVEVQSDGQVYFDIDVGFAGYHSILTSLDELRQFIVAANKWLKAREQYKLTADICPICGEPWPETETILPNGELGCKCKG